MLAEDTKQGTSGYRTAASVPHTSTLLTLFVAWVAFAYRFSAPYFHNDHFEHLSMARQVLFGEFPIRDFIDPGRPLTIGLSALAQWMAPNLLSEAILTMGALAMGAAVTFRLATRATRSQLLGLCAAAVVIVILPRLYSYPKILVFSLSLLALWRYIDTPSLARRGVLAAAVVFAFLMRHDFGIYAGVASGVTVFVTPRWFEWRRTASFIALGLLLVSPYLVWLSSIGQLGATGTSGAANTRDWLTTRNDISRPAVHFDLTHGIVHIDPVLARIHVRWSAKTDNQARQAAEARYSLVEGADEGQRTFAYGLTDDSAGNLRALVNDEHVDDTAGLNRQTLVLDGGWSSWWTRKLPIGRIVWGPFFDVDGAGVWLYYFVWGIPLAAFMRLGLKRARPEEWRTVGSAAFLGILLNLYLIRGSYDSRIPDVIVPAAIVGAWLTREYVDWVRRARVLPSLLLAFVGAGIGVLFWASLTTYETTASVGRLATAGFRFAQLRAAAAELAQRPIDFYAPPGGTGMKRLTRYVFECVPPGDRVLLVAYEPQVFYYSERLFAGGMEYFHKGRYSSGPELAKTVERLKGQRVPLVIVEQDRASMFKETYGPVYDHVRDRYHLAASATFIDNRNWDVFADNLRPEVSRRDDGLPCYQ